MGNIVAMPVRRGMTKAHSRRRRQSFLRSRGGLECRNSGLRDFGTDWLGGSHYLEVNCLTGQHRSDGAGGSASRSTIEAGGRLRPTRSHCIDIADI